MNKRIMNTLQKHFFRAFLLCLTVTFILGNNSITALAVVPHDEEAIPHLPAGQDFATQVLGDGWDMSEYSDISTYMNQSGQANLLENIGLANGTFSAKATGAHQSMVTLLFPGYLNALLIDKVGEKFPINASQYRCLYVAAKVDSGAPQNGAPDQMVVYWFYDEYLNSGVWGQTLPGIQLYPEAGAGTPSPKWKLFSARLDEVSIPSGGYTRWNNSPDGHWRGLRIDPTIQATTFQLDWVRLTDCNPVNLTINHDASGEVSVWIKPEGTSREIQVIAGVSSKTIQLDTQGFQPGSYQYIVKKDGNAVKTGDFEIDEPPIAQFARPSFTSGQEYAASSGNPWDMSDAQDVEGSQCTSPYLNTAEGVLELTTQSSNNQPPNCHGGPSDAPDTGIFLNTPAPADTGEYRYFSYRMYTEGPWQNVPEGMIGRFLWYVPGVSGLPDNRCILVSAAIPFDVGWYEGHLDLHDPISGKAVVTSQVDCPSSMDWKYTSPAMELRWNPNENITGSPMYQKLDWIKLNKMDEVQHGQNFSIQVGMNINWSSLTNWTLYYTTDRSQPRQHPIQLQQQAVYDAMALSVDAGRHLFMPILKKNNASQSSLPNQRTFMWDTSSVTPGQYYICIEPERGNYTTDYCSEAPVVVW